MKTREFEKSVVELVTGIRDELKMVDDLSSFSFNIKMAGRVHSGDVKVTYSICKSSYGADVDGHSIKAVIEEFKRRNGWTQLNQPLCISFEGEEVNAS